MIAPAVNFNSVAFTLGVRTTAGLQANFYRADRLIADAVKRSTRDAADMLDELWARRIPVDSGFMLAHRRVRLTRGGYGFEAGWDADEFLGAGLAFYPPYQEFGTSKMSAQPSLAPAWREVAPMYQAELRALIAEAVRRLDVGGTGRAQ